MVSRHGGSIEDGCGTGGVQLVAEEDEVGDVPDPLAVNTAITALPTGIYQEVRYRVTQVLPSTIKFSTTGVVNTGVVNTGLFHACKAAVCTAVLLEF